MSRPLETKHAETQSGGPRLSPLAGKPAPREMLVEPAKLEREYFGRKPELGDPNAGHFACHPGTQPRSTNGFGGRHCHHTFPQSTRRRWLQVQPAERRPG